MTKPLLIIGSGDHATVVADLAHALGREVIGHVEPRPVEVERPKVLGDLQQDRAWVKRCRGTEFVVAIGSNKIRADAFAIALELGLGPATLVHPAATLLGGASVGEGAQVCAGAIIGVSATVSANVIVNTGATLDHHNLVKAHAFVGPGAHLAGRVIVGEGAHIGIGASVREGLAIGSWATVAAGAAVVTDVPDNTRWGGVPARSLPNRQEGDIDDA